MAYFTDFVRNLSGVSPRQAVQAFKPAPMTMGDARVELLSGLTVALALVPEAVAGSTGWVSRPPT